MKAWICPECLAEIESGALDRRFDANGDPLSLIVYDDASKKRDGHLFVECRRHCRILLEMPLHREVLL